MKRAVALQYEDAVHDAPVVVSTGEGDLAERIERAARDWGIPVVHDVPLAAALSELAVGDAIPEALYESIAAILSDAKYAALRIVTVIEPDSLPNLVTNTDVAECATMKSNGNYVSGVAYALTKLGAITESLHTARIYSSRGGSAPK